MLLKNKKFLFGNLKAVLSFILLHGIITPTFMFSLLTCKQATPPSSDCKANNLLTRVIQKQEILIEQLKHKIRCLCSVVEALSLKRFCNEHKQILLKLCHIGGVAFLKDSSPEFLCNNSHGVQLKLSEQEYREIQQIAAEHCPTLWKTSDCDELAVASTKNSLIKEFLFGKQAFNKNDALQKKIELMQNLMATHLTDPEIFVLVNFAKNNKNVIERIFSHLDEFIAIIIKTIDWN